MKDQTGKFELAYTLYCDGNSLSQVAKKIGGTRQGVYKAFKCRGYDLRGRIDREHQTFDGIRFTRRNNGYYGMTNGSRMLMHRYVWSFYNGDIPEGYDIHHINENKSDNRIENLECLSKSEHTRKYSPHNNQYTRGRKLCR